MYDFILLIFGAFKPKSQNGRRGAGVVMQKYVKNFTTAATFSKAVAVVSNFFL